VLSRLLFFLRYLLRALTTLVLHHPPTVFKRLFTMFHTHFVGKLWTFFFFSGAVAPPPYFSTPENATAVDRLGPCTHPQALSRSPTDHVHGSRARELFVSAMSGCATVLLRYLVIFLSRRSRTDTDGADHKLLERLEAELNLLRKNLYAV